ncbi:DDB1-and CUL4-substrate receptor 15, WD repeat, partial [Halocaridina rubra]
MYGETRQSRSRPRERLFHQLPHRLAFSLTQVAPQSALAAGHIFLGFTKCGQFLLSYTHSSDADDHTLQMIHRYRLHWWVFVPYAPLRKVAEVMLFGDQHLQESLHENIFISVCQWPRDLSKIVVYGCSTLEGSDGNMSQTRRCFVTITAVPSLDNCSECYEVATSYEEEDLAERWNSCVRFSCLQHGITVHTSFEMVPPFPKFIPNVQMKREGYIVLNAGNFIHVLNVELENRERKMKEMETEILGIRLNRISAEERVEESDDERQQNRRKGSAPNSNAKENCNLTACNSKDEDVLDSSSSDIDADADIHSVCEEEEFSFSVKEEKVMCSNSNSLKITLNSNNSLNGTSMSDKDREWEILIGSVAQRSSSSRARKELYSDMHAPCSSTSKEITSDSQSVGHSKLTNKSPASVHELEENEALGYNYTLKEFQLPDESPYHFYSDAYNFNDNDSDDSTRCSHFSEDSRLSRSDLRDVNLNERWKSGAHGCVTITKPEEKSFTSPSSQQPSRMILRSSGESACSEKSSTQAEKEYEFIDEILETHHEKLSVFRRRRLADKKYEFSDENSENVPKKYSSFRNQTRRLIMSPSRSPKFRTMAVPLSELSIELGESSGLLRSVYEKLLSPTSGSGSPSDVLRPINQNISSPILSPRDDRWREEMDRMEKVELQRWSSRESLGFYGLSPNYPQKSTEKSSHVGEKAGNMADLGQSQ